MKIKPHLLNNILNDFRYYYSFFQFTIKTYEVKAYKMFHAIEKTSHKALIKNLLNK